MLAALFCGRSANASVIITLDQVDPNVVAKGSGTLDLTDLTFTGTANTGVGIIPSFGFLGLGEPTTSGGNITINDYIGISGPTEFGTFIVTVASTSSGSQLVLNGLGTIGVPVGYVFGTPLSAMATWDNTTIVALGVIPGVYTWTWGSGDHADSLTLFAGVPIPEPDSALLLTLGAAGLALLKWRSSIRCIRHAPSPPYSSHSLPITVASEPGAE